MLKAGQSGTCGRIPSHWYVRAIRVTLSHHPSHVERTCDQSSFFNHRSLLRLLLSSFSPVSFPPSLLSSPLSLLLPFFSTPPTPPAYDRGDTTVNLSPIHPLWLLMNNLPKSLTQLLGTKPPVLIRCSHGHRLHHHPQPPPPLHQSKPTPMNPRL
jgi:hypothetical protein